MKFIVKCLFVLFLAAPVHIIAQEAPPKASAKPEGSRAKRKAERKKWKEQRKRDHAEAKAIKKHHKRIQTKETRATMRKNKRKANRVNQNKKEFFIKRWFSKKRA
jgi:hypothetical protein